MCFSISVDVSDPLHNAWLLVASRPRNAPIWGVWIIDFSVITVQYFSSSIEQWCGTHNGLRAMFRWHNLHLKIRCLSFLFFFCISELLAEQKGLWYKSVSFVIARHHRGSGVFIGNLKQSTRSFGPVWLGGEERRIGYYVMGAAAGLHREQTPGALL